MSFTRIPVYVNVAAGMPREAQPGHLDLLPSWDGHEDDAAEDRDDAGELGPGEALLQEGRGEADGHRAEQAAEGPHDREGPAENPHVERDEGDAVEAPDPEEADGHA